MTLTRYFELIDDQSRKFWCIEVSGPAMKVRFGRIGAQGQTKLTSFASEDEARAAAENLIREKTKKGYIEKSAGAESAESAESAAVVLATAPGSETPHGVEQAVDAFVALVKSIVGKWTGIPRARTSEESLATIRARFDAPEEYFDWLRAFAGKRREACVPDVSGNLMDVIPASRILSTHEFVLGLHVEADRDEAEEARRYALVNAGEPLRAVGFAPGWLPFVESGRHGLYVDLDPAEGGTKGQVIELQLDSDVRRVVARSISEHFASWTRAIRDGEVLFTRDDEEEEEEEASSFPSWTMWRVAELQRALDRKLVDDLTYFCPCAATTRLSAEGSALVPSLVDRGLIELRDDGKLGPRACLGLGLLSRASSEKARTEIVEIALVWLEDDDAVDEVFATAETLLSVAQCVPIAEEPRSAR